MAKPKPSKKKKSTISSYEPKGYDPKRIWQETKDQDVFEDLDFDPKYVPHLYLENVIQRTISRMMGKGPYGPVTVKCTSDGSLAVVARGGAFDDYERIDHYFTGANQAVEKTFTQQVTRIDIFTYSGQVDYQLTRDAVKAYGSKINLFEDSFYSLDFDTLKVKATSKTWAPRASGTTTATSAGKLVDSGAGFVAAGVAVGDIVVNTTDNTVATVTAVDSATQLSVSPDIFVSGENYVINGTRLTLVGWFREAG